MEGSAQWTRQEHTTMTAMAGSAPRRNTQKIKTYAIARADFDVRFD